MSSKQGCGFKCLPLGPTEYLTFSDRSIAHHLLLIEQAPASARSEDCSRAKTAHAFAIVVFAGDLLRWPSDLPRRSSEVRDPERTVPRALLFGVLTVTVLYILISAVFLYLVLSHFSIRKDQTRLPSARGLWMYLLAPD